MFGGFRSILANELCCLQDLHIHGAHLGGVNEDRTVEVVKETRISQKLNIIAKPLPSKREGERVASAEKVFPQQWGCYRIRFLRTWDGAANNCGCTPNLSGVPQFQEAFANCGDRCSGRPMHLASPPANSRPALLSRQGHDLALSILLEACQPRLPSTSQ